MKAPSFSVKATGRIEVDLHPVIGPPVIDKEGEQEVQLLDLSVVARYDQIFIMVQDPGSYNLKIGHNASGRI